MRNILKYPPVAHDVAAILHEHRAVKLLAPMGDIKWGEVFAKAPVQKWMEVIRPMARREIDEPLPKLTDELYADFHATGARLPFEKIYFERRRRLARAVMCALEQGTPNGAWLDSATRKMMEIFDEESWALPAHVSHASGKDPRRIDLFAAETANLMAELLTLFEAVLSPRTMDRVLSRLKKDIFLNYMAGTFVWTSITNNWNAVCHQGVLGAALAVESDEQLVADMLVKAASCLPAFLNGFGDDGCCDEGPIYWEYGFGWFCELNRQLEARTGGEYSLVDDDPKVRAIANFPARVIFKNAHVVNFSDSAATKRLRPALLDYIAQRFHDTDVEALASENYAALDAQGLDFNELRSDVFMLTKHFQASPTRVHTPSSIRKPINKPDVYFANTHWLITRSTDAQNHLWEFAAKAGHNEENHNHNDCGSFLLNIDGARLITEIGMPEYVRDYFGPRRYEFLAARSRGHCLPMIQGFEQAGGRTHAAKVLSRESNEKSSSFTMDLAACYPAEAHCSSAIRQLNLNKREGSLHVSDKIVLNQILQNTSTHTAIITDATVKKIDNGVEIIRDATKIKILCDENTSVVNIEEHGYRNHQGEDRTIRRVVLASKETGANVAMGYTVTVG